MMEKYGVSRSNAVFLIAEAINCDAVLEEVLAMISRATERKEID